MENEIPKKIWFLWLQGEDNMPEIIRNCYNSWKKNNLNWEINFLDNKNLKTYLDLELLNLNKISKQAISDIIRINLLKKYGGVWVDATTFCNQPLDKWINKYAENDFFAFESPKEKPTLISSWFLMAKKNSYIANKYCEATNDFWNENPKLKLLNKIRLYRYFFKITLLKYYLDKHPQKWFSSFFIKFLKIHPYYWFHYIFEKLYIEDDKYKTTWDNCKKISSDIPHKLQIFGLTKNISEEGKKEIINTNAPLYKLNWRVNLNNKKSVLNFLFNQK